VEGRGERERELRRGRGCGTLRDRGIGRGKRGKEGELEGRK